MKYCNDIIYQTTWSVGGFIIGRKTYCFSKIPPPAPGEGSYYGSIESTFMVKMWGTHFCVGGGGSLTSKIEWRGVIMGVFQYSIKELATYLQWIQNIYFNLITFQNCCKSKPVISCKKSKAARVACIYERKNFFPPLWPRSSASSSFSVCRPRFRSTSRREIFARTKTLAWRRQA